MVTNNSHAYDLSIQYHYDELIHTRSGSPLLCPACHYYSDDKLKMAIILWQLVSYTGLNVMGFLCLQQLRIKVDSAKFMSDSFEVSGVLREPVVVPYSCI